MTLIECFDRTILENIAGTLYLQPDKLIIVGDKKKTRVLPQLFSDLLEKRGIRTRIMLCDTAGMTIIQIAEALAKIVENEEQCVIDLTGGEEPVIMAVGAMMAGLADTSKLSIQKFDLINACAADCDCDGQVACGRYMALTVEELIALHGGKVHPASYQPPKHYSVKDIEKLWEIVSGSPRQWNDWIGVLSEFEKRSESKEYPEIPRSKLRAELRSFDRKAQTFEALIEQFDRNGIIHDQSDSTTIRYRYSSDLYRYCTKKAGNVLELKVFLEARALEEKGKPYFDDCLTGVTIDWDGVIQDKTDNIPDTRNEVDLVLTRGLCSLFISCKNGYIDEAELYKLNTVAQRFGGPYARKMLIATDLDQKTPSSTRAFIQRARDMNIILVTDAAELESQEWKDLFRTAMR